MKKLLYFLYVLLGFVVTANAQNVSIPDTNFKAALIAQGVDTNGDGEIQVGEAQALTYLNVNNSNISDLTGIEEFVNLVMFQCSGNAIAHLDFSNNVNLTHLNCSNTQLTGLDVSNNSSLTFLNCSGNALNSLDISNNGVQLDFVTHLGLCFSKVLDKKIPSIRDEYCSE